MEVKDLHQNSGAAEGIRTPDPRITNALLYRLSYRGVWSMIRKSGNRFSDKIMLPSKFSDTGY